MSRRVLPALLALIGATLVSTAGGGTSAATTLSGRHVASAADCMGQSSARVPKWAPHAHEPAAIGALQSAQLAQRIEPGLAAAQRAAARGALNPGLVRIRTWVHVISIDRTVAGGNVSNQQINAQMRVLNRSFSGATGGAPTVFRFDLVGVTRTVNPAWSKMETEDDEFAAKSALRRGGPETLNLYVGQIGGDLLGWAYLPDGETEDTPWDGVVVLAGSLPGGDVEPYNEGDTATHEVGHWLALLHTFDNECVRPGDAVFDTPYEAEPAFGCPTGRDSCPQPGNDPVENFMDYSDDPCMHEFTFGQSLRMWGAWRIFRA